MVGYDIDYVDELALYLNDILVGYLVTGPDDMLNIGETFELPAAAQVPGMNVLKFVQKTPGWKWGVTDLLLSEVEDATDPADPDLLAEIAALQKTVQEQGERLGSLEAGFGAIRDAWMAISWAMSTPLAVVLAAPPISWINRV